MEVVERPAGPGGVLANIGLGVVFALGIAFTAYMLKDSWGEGYWIPTTGVAVVMCALALLRERRRPWTAAAGVAVAASAVVAALVADLPQEPSPVTALALAVLVGSSIRRLPARLSVAIVGGGVAVIALAWVSGPSSVTVMATVLVAGGLVVGPLFRVLARHGGPGAPATEASPVWGRRH